MFKTTTLLLLSTLQLVGCSLDSDLDYQVNKQQIIVEDHFISSNEPKVIDALWSDDDAFKVAVSDDGTNHDGYAQYVCQVLYKKGFEGEAVQVDVVNYDRPFLDGNWVSIGTAQCQEQL
jgi:hypothetical protein